MYRRNGTWAMNSTTEGKYRALPFDQLEYVWQPPETPGGNSKLLNYEVINPEAMDDIAANAFPVVFGDFMRGYQVARRMDGVSIQRLVERYAEYDQTGLLFKHRVGGLVLQSEAFTPIKIATS